MKLSRLQFAGRLLALNLLIPALAGAATITADGSLCTLADAIRAANTDLPAGGCSAGSGPDIIDLAANESITVAEAAAAGSTTILGGSAGLPDVVSTITIQAVGAGDRIERQAVLACSNSSDAFRIFNVLGAGNLTLVGITVANGCIAPDAEPAFGGGFYLANTGSLTLQLSTVSGNTANGSNGSGPTPGQEGLGGGVYAFGGTVTLTASTFTGNLALGGDGSDVLAGGTARGGALAQEGGTLDTTGTTFSTNSALGGYGSTGGDALGGAIFLAEDTVATIETNSFIASIAQGGGSASAAGDAEGGALAAIGSASIAALTLSTFVDNLATAGSGADGATVGGHALGGGLFLVGGAHGPFERLIVRGNRALGGGATSSGGLAAGGGLYCSLASLTALRESHFADNTARGGSANGVSGSGGAAFGGALGLDGPLPEISGSTFSGNRVEGGDGVTFGGTAEGGGVSLDSAGALLVINTTIYGNVAYGGTSSGSGHGSAAGGGLHDSGSLTTLRHVTVAANQAHSEDESAGGGISGTFTLDNTVLADNLVTGPSPAGADCVNAVISAGFNHAENPGASCTLAAVGDVVGSDPLLGPFGDHGCTPGRVLPGGGCVPTVALLLTSLPLDAGSSAVSGASLDERGFPRPVDIATVANAADACDKGAFELQALEAGVDLAITKAAPATNPAVGASFGYVLTVSNQSVISTGTGVTVTDPVPAGLVFVGSTCGAIEGGGVVTWTIGTLATGTTANCTLTFKRLAPAAISNQATVGGNEVDLDLADNVAAAQLESVPGAAVPTFSGWAMLLLAMTLAALAISRLRA